MVRTKGAIKECTFSPDKDRVWQNGELNQAFERRKKSYRKMYEQIVLWLTE